MPALSTLIVVLLAAPARALLLDGALRPGVGVAAARCAPAKAQLAPAPQKTRQKTFTTGPGGGKGGGGGAPSAAIAKPKRKAIVEEVPLYKVILLGDEEYEEDPVRPAPAHPGPPPAPLGGGPRPTARAPMCAALRRCAQCCTR